MQFNIAELGELQVTTLQALWRLGGATVHELLNAIEREPAPAYTTVLTVLRSLEKRGLVRHDASGRDRQYRYYAVISAAEAERAALCELLDRVFDGSTDRLLRRLAEMGRLPVLPIVLPEEASANGHAALSPSAAEALAPPDPTPEEPTDERFTEYRSLIRRARRRTV